MKHHESLDFALAFRDALAALYAPASNREFPARVLAVFGALFAHESVSYDEIGHRRGVLRNSLNMPPPVSREGWARRWKRWAGEHPGVIYRRSGGSRTVFRLGDLMPERELEATAFYREFWKDAGIRHQLTAVAPAPGRIVAVSVNREVPFSDGEVHRMELMQPHFAQAYGIMKSLDPVRRVPAGVDLGKVVEGLFAAGNLEAVGGVWKGNPLTGELWRS